MLTNNQLHILTSLELILSTISGFSDINDPAIDVYLLQELDLLSKQGCFSTNEISAYFINLTGILNQLRKQK
jgi:hypothetical protein